MAFPLAILATEKKTESWIYSNFIQTCLDLDLYKSPVPYYYYIFDYTISPYLEIQKLKRDTSDRMFTNVIEFLDICIDLDYYIYLNVDEYYIPHRENTFIKHFSHDVLINGIDSEAKELSVYGFTDKRKLECITVKFKDFNNAYNHIKEIEKDLLQITLYRFNSEAEFTFDLNGFIEQLDEYLYGKNSSLRFSPLRTPWDRIYGIKACDYLINYMEECISQNIKIEIIIFQFLYEYHALMKYRIEFLLENKILKNRDILKKWDGVLKSCMIIRNYFLKADVKGAIDKNINSVKSIVSDMFMNEKIILNELLDILKGKAVHSNKALNSTRRVIAN